MQKYRQRDTIRAFFSSVDRSIDGCFVSLSQPLLFSPPPLSLKPAPRLHLPPHPRRPAGHRRPSGLGHGLPSRQRPRLLQGRGGRLPLLRLGQGRRRALQGRGLPFLPLLAAAAHGQLHGLQGRARGRRRHHRLRRQGQQQPQHPEASAEAGLRLRAGLGQRAQGGAGCGLRPRARGLQRQRQAPLGAQAGGAERDLGQRGLGVRPRQRLRGCQGHGEGREGAAANQPGRRPAGW